MNELKFLKIIAFITLTSLELFDDVFLVDIRVKTKNINHPICSVSLTIKPMRYIIKYAISYKLASTCSAILLTRTRLFFLSEFRLVNIPFM